jgi:hypothetical protein
MKIFTLYLKLRDHACPYCFGAKSTMTKHVDMMHLKRRDHACPCCPGVTFGYKSPLMTHINNTVT